MEIYEKEIIIHEFLSHKQDVRPIGIIESGQWGFAIALIDGRHLKLTTDMSEIEVCKVLVGKKNIYLCDVYEVGVFYSPSQSREYGWIIEEHLYKGPDQLWLNEAFKDFRHAWFSLFPRSTERFTWSHLWAIYRLRQFEKINRTRELLKKYISNINNTEEQVFFQSLSEEEINIRMKRGLLFFDFISNAYEELFYHCCNGKIDLNEGNFMFSVDGKLKVIDLQIE